MQTLETGKQIALANILLATDFSPHSEVVLSYAMAIARACQSKIFGVHVVPPEDYLFTAPDLWPSHLQEEKKLQVEVTARLEEQLRGVPHEALFGTGDVWTVLSRVIGEHDIDLVVVGTHGRTGARKLLMGSIAEKVFRQAACPVLTIGPNVASNPDGKAPFQRILLATDFGKESLAALPFALHLVEEGRAQLTLLHVVDSDQPTVDIVNAEDVRTSEKRRLEELLPPDFKQQGNVECLVEFSHPFAAQEPILRVAKERGADLIVLGARPTHAAAISTVTHLAHTTDQHIVAHATCPVLTVRA
jgi:nucleotide-binding universal stress UspA family protein